MLYLTTLYNSLTGKICSDSARGTSVEVTLSQKKALSGLTGHNFGCVKATGWIFLPKCS